ncbi:hypothetical protein [Luteolibacter sp. AS25]|uniref:hypothetical protein n=1 Tax=Luteolibacter sp. AS25 TaxID=3135776 RepID=UPI00398AECCE
MPGVFMAGAYPAAERSRSLGGGFAGFREGGILGVARPEDAMGSVASVVCLEMAAGK